MHKVVSSMYKLCIVLFFCSNKTFIKEKPDGELEVLDPVSTAALTVKLENSEEIKTQLLKNGCKDGTFQRSSNCAGLDLGPGPYPNGTIR